MTTVDKIGIDNQEESKGGKSPEKDNEVINQQRKDQEETRINNERLNAMLTNIKTQEMDTTKNSEEQTRDRARSKSGHARTHAIVINLDDKSRFSEEITV